GPASPCPSPRVSTPHNRRCASLLPSPGRTTVTEVIRPGRGGVRLACLVRAGRQLDPPGRVPPEHERSQGHDRADDDVLYLRGHHLRQSPPGRDQDGDQHRPDPDRVPPDDVDYTPQYLPNPVTRKYARPPIAGPASL